MSRQDDYEALLTHEHPIPRETDEDSAHDSLMAFHSANSRAKRSWLILDSAGKISQRRVDKHDLCTRLSLPMRDLRILDPTVMTSQSPSSIFIRDNAIIFNIESLRMLVEKDEVILLSSPVSGQPLTASTSPTPEDPFVKELAAVLDPLEAARSHNSSRVETFLPYELRALEHGLATAVRSWEFETLGLEKRTVPVVKSLLNKLSRHELGKLRSCKVAIRKMQGRLVIVRKALNDLLEDDEDIAAMYLTRKAAAKAAAAARAEKRADASRSASQDDELLVADAEDDEPQQSHGRDLPLLNIPIATDRTTSAPPPTSGTQVPKLSSAPSAPPSQFPSREQADSRKTGRALWGHLSNMRLAQKLIQALHTEDITDISACENLLESYFAQVDFLVNRLNALEEHIRSAEDQLALELDHRRNELVALDLFLTAVATVFAFVSMVGGLFGMNSPLPLWFQESMAAFPLTCLVTCVVGVFLFIGFVVYARWKRLLFIPDLRLDASASAA
ncbi:magnesium transporter MRS2-B [Coccomyxa sp. Obi]|nr:magnesium transporter MRS2-B [Coccomyxa sp. Obi]